jgi:hypothetical protein
MALNNWRMRIAVINLKFRPNKWDLLALNARRRRRAAGERSRPANGRRVSFALYHISHLGGFSFAALFAPNAQQSAHTIGDWQALIVVVLVGQRIDARRIDVQ